MYRSNAKGPTKPLNLQDKIISKRRPRRGQIFFYSVSWTDVLAGQDAGHSLKGYLLSPTTPQLGRPPV